MTPQPIMPQWPVPQGVKAAVTTRAGGVSHPPHDSLNLGLGNGDDPAAVMENRHRLRQALNLPNEPAWLHQVHGFQVVEAREVNPDKPPKADATITRIPGVVCAVLTADCLPVLFCDRVGGQVAAAHAGWRGLVAGVLEATVEAFDCPPMDVIAWLGPCIGPQAFEVGSEVRQAFIDDDPGADAAFVPSPQGRWLADLHRLARRRLHDCGVTQIASIEACTHSDPERFYSYRRDGETGRMASLIWLEV
ncbi:MULTISPECIES: peptidoglycan editing factor PgeF [unclassified Ectothiorhodospira]|uniref:peptidoglycan editing factor PgeF n=1 Tax=unclassified Ectothiorhodospira TaxID=2684909 RepID=UPI001EE97622|nr:MULTISPECIES: peptidoglycan editing factor PgeF [unclassified Ectothiorhodospira]MCG5515304.1 peptidoglycan editing factor PgeF [Ectothiorhodospira sp. 9100]MCG5519415.1 peptidoglycan editing factor PgeF [Ectothiorhodospira sp. 9905]